MHVIRMHLHSGSPALTLKKKKRSFIIGKQRIFSFCHCDGYRLHPLQTLFRKYIQNFQSVITLEFHSTCIPFGPLNSESFLPLNIWFKEPIEKQWAYLLNMAIGMWLRINRRNKYIFI